MKRVVLVARTLAFAGFNGGTVSSASSRSSCVFCAACVEREFGTD